MNSKRPSAVTCRCDRFDVRSRPLVTRRASIIVAVPLNRCPVPEKHWIVSVGMLRLWIPICLAVLSGLWFTSLSAQPLECTGKAAQAQLSAIDPIYVDAMELARS
jgi:hypothetical protein